MLPPACRNLSVLARRAFWLVLIVSLAVALPCCFAQEDSLAATKEKPPPSPAVPPDVSKQLLAEFRRIYALPDDKVVKRVPPPFSPGRLEFYRVHDAEQAKSIPKGPEYMWFRCDVKSALPDATREGRLFRAGMGWVGGQGVPIADLVEGFTARAYAPSTGIHSYEMEGDRKLMWMRVQGDWVIRDDVPAEKMLQGFEAVLREECQVPIRFRLLREDRRVIVAEGRYAFRPLPGHAGLADESGVSWDRLDVFEKDGDKMTSDWGSSLDDVFSIVGSFINRPVINEVSGRPENPVCCGYNVRRYNACRTSGGADEAAILKHLSEQTGLTFAEKTRRVRILLVERAE